MDNIVLDTNVLISAMRSNRGASFKLFSLIGTGRFDINVSVPLVLEYEDVLNRQAGAAIALSKTEIGDVLDYLCSTARHFRVYYLWRPLLRDPHDDMVLELAVTAECPLIVTYNVSDFVGIERFGIEAITPKVLLERMGRTLMSAINLRLPASLHEVIRELAKEDNVSINQFITLALTEKVSALMTEEYLTERAQRGSRAKFEAALAKVADVEPDEEDRL